MSKAKEYNYTPNDVEVLSKAQDALANLKLLLKKGSILHSDELLIKFYYQCLGNCLKKLPMDLIEADPQLKHLIFWARAENPNNGRHLFDRMDTAHEADILNFIRDSIVGSAEIWLAECEALSSLIEQKHQIGGCPIVADCESFNLITEGLPQFLNDTKTEEYTANIVRAFAIIDSIGADSRVLPTLPNMIIILMANQIIGNNFNKLSEFGYVFGDEALLRAVIDRRNGIAHAMAFDPSVTPSYFFRKYVGLCDVRKIIEPLVSALTAVVTAEDAPPLEAAAASPAPLERNDGSAALQPHYYEAHLELFKKLQVIRVIAKDKVPNPDVSGQIFSDTELLCILMEFIVRDYRRNFETLLDNLKFYTETKAKCLINTPMLYNMGKSRQALQSECREGMDMVLSYLSDYKPQYFPNQSIAQACSSDEFKAKVYPSIRFVYLLEIALSSKNWEVSVFLNKLLSLGANPNIQCMAGALLSCSMLGSKLTLPILLISHGADPNVCSNGRTILSKAVEAILPAMNDILGYVDVCAHANAEKQRIEKLSLIAKATPPVDYIRSLVTYGADPRKEVAAYGFKMHLLGKIMLSPPEIRDQSACEVSRIIINCMADKYGFESIQTMLKSLVRRDQSAMNDNGRQSRSKRVRLINKQQLLVDVIIDVAADDRALCKKLINLLLGLNGSRSSCELFKVILTDNLEAIKDFVENYSLQEQHSLMSDKFICAMIKGDAPAEIGIYEFAKIFCSKETQAYLLTLQVTLVRHHRGKAVVASVDRGDSKNDDDTPPPPLGLAAGLVSAQPQHQRESSTSLQALPPTHNDANIVEVGMLAASFAATYPAQEGKEHFSR